VFVVWRIVNESNELKKKLRVVTNIRELNKFVVINGHFILIQSDVIAHIRDCNHISLMNDLAFFFQFLVIMANKHKFFLINYRGKEELQVVVIRFKNSLAYVQRVMNEQLREFREFVRVYIDDIIVFFKTFI